MKSMKTRMFLCHSLVSSIVVLMIGFLGLGVTAFATADTAKSVFVAAFLIVLMTLALYFMRRRPTLEAIASRLATQHPVHP